MEVSAKLTRQYLTALFLVQAIGILLFVVWVMTGPPTPFLVIGAALAGIILGLVCPLVLWIMMVKRPTRRS